jgi:hypothetical protein
MNEPLLPKVSISERLHRPHIGRNSHYIVRDLCKALQDQMDAISQDSLDDLSEAELTAYRLREKKIRELRQELGDFSLWAS